MSLEDLLWDMHQQATLPQCCEARVASARRIFLAACEAVPADDSGIRMVPVTEDLIAAMKAAL